MAGKFSEPLIVSEKGQARFGGDLELALPSSVIGAETRARWTILVNMDWRLYRPAQFLLIQPVFIGTGPGDSSATGTAFSTLMDYAHTLWNRCGSVRCVKFAIYESIYVEHNAHASTITPPGLPRCGRRQTSPTRSRCSWSNGCRQASRAVPVEDSATPPGRHRRRL